MQVSLFDCILAMRYLLRFSPGQRREKCASLLRRANFAQTYVDITGRVHPLYGDGSLSALSLRIGIAAMPTQLSRDTIETLALVLHGVEGHLNKTENQSRA